MKLTEFEQARHMEVTFELAEQTKTDNRFTPVKIWIAHVGKNLNKSFFSKERLMAMIPSLAFIPVVGFIQADSSNKDDFAGHEQQIVVNVDGVSYEYLGRMYGFVPENHNARFETKICKDGVEREFLVADGIIVNKFAKAKEILDRDEVKSQSMELVRESFEGNYDKENDQYVVTNAEFDALCFLGDSRLPAMVGGAIEKMQFSSLKFELQEIMKDFTKGGGELLNIEKLKEILVDYEYVSTEFVADLETKLDTFETIESLQEILDIENKAQFALTVLVQLDMLDKEVRGLETYIDYWKDEYPRFNMQDAKLDEMQVFCFDYKDYKEIGFTFEKVGEEFKVNKESKFNVAWQPTMLESGDSSDMNVFSVIKEEIATTINKFESVISEKATEFETALTSALESQKTEYETKLSEVGTELDSLKQYKTDVETKTKTEYVKNVENLSDFEKEEILSKVSEFSMEQITDEVAKIVGKKMIKFSAGEIVVDTLPRSTEDNRAKKSYDCLFQGK